VHCAETGQAFVVPISANTKILAGVTKSNLRMESSLSQSGRTPGSTLTLRARLTEYGVPVDHRASIHARLATHTEPTP